MFTFLKNSASRWAIGAYVVARVALTAWSLLIALSIPIVLQNLDLFGTPVLAVFDVVSGERYAYSRVIGGTVLMFRVGDPGTVIDQQTQSVWSLREARAIAGTHAGVALRSAFYSVEDVFPYRGVATESNLLLSVWQRFDTNWYIKIAQQGYTANDGSTVYFPLYPLLVRIVSIVVPNRMLAALLVSNLAGIGALYFLYRLTQSLFDESTARRIVAYWLLFPTGFFLLAAYTESPFLFLTLGAFFYAKQNRWYISALFGVLAALTRLQGVLLIVPLGWMLYQQAKSMRRVLHFTLYVSLLIIPLATAAFLAFTNLSFIASYEGELHARFVMPWENLAVSVALLAGGLGSFVDALNLVATVGFGTLLYFVWQKFPREYGLYSIAMFFAPLCRMTTTQPLVSMDRYMLALFPVFMLWAAWGKNPWLNRVIVYLSFPLQLYLSAQFVLWGWIG